MKLTLFFVLSLSGMVAGASDVCYDLSLSRGVSAPASVPKTICLDKLSIDTDSKSVFIESQTQAAQLQGFEVSIWRRASEETFDFEIQKRLVQDWSSPCGPGESVLISIAGEVSEIGSALTEALDIKAVRNSTSDTCHSDIQEVTYRYRSRPTRF